MARGKKLRTFPQGQGPDKPAKSKSSKKPNTGKPVAAPPASAKVAAAEPATVPAQPGSMDAPAVRTLTEGRLEQMRERFVRLYGELEAHEASAKDLQKQAADEKAEAKRIREELHQLREAIDTGVENARQADLFAHEQRPAKPRPRPEGPAETESRAHDIPPARADATLAEVAKRAETLEGKNAGDDTTTRSTSTGGANAGDVFAFGEDEPPPAMDPAQAGPTRIEAERDEPAEAGA